MKLYTVEFAARISVSANNQKEALKWATGILDNRHCYPTSVNDTYAYPDPLDISTLDPTAAPAPAPAPSTDDDAAF
jgi:hypothetical protein